MFAGIEAALDAAFQCGKALRLRMKHLDHGADLVGGADQRGVTAGRIEPLAQRAGMGVGGGRQRRPDQPAAPVVGHLAAAFARELLPEAAAGRRRADDPPYRPQRARAVGGERLDVADRAPQRGRGIVRDQVGRAVA